MHRDEEKKRLEAAPTQNIPWRKWGPYLSERQWGTVREDYSESGDAWNFFTHDHARSRAYRWGNASYQNIVAWVWRFAGDFALIVVNLSDSSAQGLVRLPWNELADRSWQMTDLFTGHLYERNGNEIRHHGLYIDLPPWDFHVLTRWAMKG